MLFCSIDTPSLQLAGRVCGVCRQFGLRAGVKFGYQFIFTHGVSKAVEAAQGLPLILDLKFHDIPNTVVAGLQAIPQKPHQYITIHTSGGRDMMKAATSTGHKLLGVTVLTSIGSYDLGSQVDLKELVLHRAKTAIDCGIHGLVCSGQEVEAVRSTVGNTPFILVPGVRLDNRPTQDQKRVTTPEQALQAGADAIAMGREAIAAAKESDAVLSKLIHSVTAL